MSKEAVEGAIGGAVKESEFRELRFANPEEALAGYKLADTEMVALKAIDAERLTPRPWSPPKESWASASPGCSSLARALVTRSGARPAIPRRTRSTFQSWADPWRSPSAALCRNVGNSQTSSEGDTHGFC